MATNTSTAAIASAQVATRRRPWYRLHLSTLILLFPVVPLLTVLILPGEFPTGVWPAIRCEHGWPWMYLQREIVDEATSMKALQSASFTGTQVNFPPDTPAADLLNTRLLPSYTGSDPSRLPDWMDAWAWWGPAAAHQWRPGVLAADMAIGGLILFGVAALLEWRRRRHARAWQFSLGELACVVTVVAGGLGWWRANVDAARADEAAYAKSGGANVHFRGASKITLTRSSVSPLWLRRLLGANNLGSFERTTTFKCDTWTFKETPAGLTAHKFLTSVSVEKVIELESLAAWLKSIPSIEEVEVCPDQCIGIETLCRTGKITSIDLSGWLTLSVRDADLESLRLSPKLKKINLARSAVTDDGMRHLAALRNLRELSLWRTAITDAGIAQLTGLKKLELLNLSQTAVTDEGLRSVASLKRLNELDLRGDVRITGADLYYLTALPNLQVLNVANTKLTALDLARLRSSVSLKELRFMSGQISRQEQAVLQDSWPGCKIVNSW